PSPADTIASGYSSRPVVTSDTSSYPLPTPTTQFCRAIHPYNDTDPAILSFSRGDVIEIMSKHTSGWWDCLVGDTWNGYGLGGTVRRGWVPSNYVRMLGSREEAKAFVQLQGMDSKTKS
ncbi:SH3 domain-containing protein, partial [Coprinopsis sp. MPI-PUGE-AT-0042]